MLWPLFAIAVSASPQVVRAMKHDVSFELRALPPATAGFAPEHDEPESMQYRMPAGLGFDPVLQPRAFFAAPAAATSFDGIGPSTRTVNANPPDANAAVGPEHIVEVTNFRFAIFSKTGEILYGPAATSTPWLGFDGRCGKSDRGDPVVLYDRLADRWVMIHMAWDDVTSTGSQCVAVSRTADPVGAWFLYEFPFNSTNDAGKIGLWPDAYVYTTMLTVNDGRARICAFDRTRMLAGSDATQQCFILPVNEPQPIPADLDGARLPPAGAPAWLVGPAYGGTLGAFRLHVDWQDPSGSSLSPRIAVPVAHWDAPGCAECIPQPGTTQRLLAGVGDLGQRIAYRSFADHEALVLSHSVDAGSGSMGVRWYELRPDAAGIPVVYQQGTFAPDAMHRWMPSAAMDASGNIAIGYSVASESLYPSIRYAARLAGDPSGLLTFGEASLHESTASQTWSPRWGDYSSMQIDPIDDCTFWYTAEYPGDTNPATRISAFRLAGCGFHNDFTLSVVPTSRIVNPGASVDYEIATANKSGVAEPISLSADGLPSGTSQVIKPESVVAGESAILTVAASPRAPQAPLTTFTVVATSPSATHVATARIHVDDQSAPGDPDSGATDAGALTTDAGSYGGASPPDAQTTTPPATAANPSGCGCRSSNVPLALLTGILTLISRRKEPRRTAR